MSKIFYLMGKSASGKDTIYKKLKDIFPELKTVVIYTTRPIRSNETEGVDYHFVDENKLWELQKNGKVIEARAYNSAHGIWTYFTVDDGQFDEDVNYIAIGTLESFVKLKKYFGEDRVIPIYIEVEDGLRLERALARERAMKDPKYKEMCRRFLADTEDFSEEKIEEAGIPHKFFNIDMEKCVEEIVLGIRDNLCYTE